MLNLELSLKMAMKMTNKWPVQERGELGGVLAGGSVFICVYINGPIFRGAEG